MNDNVCRECETQIGKDYELRIAATHVQPNQTSVEVTEANPHGEAQIGMWSAAEQNAGTIVVTLTINLTTLPGKGLRVRKPFPVTLTLDGDVWTADQKDFNICATGETPEDAELSIAEYISEDFVHWRHTLESLLSDDAESLLAKYRGYLTLATD